MLPYRGLTGATRPEALRALALPPAPMAALRRGRPLKAWRYVAFFAPELTACLAQIRIGPFGDSFWAVWDRSAGLFWQGRRRVSTGDSAAAICAPGVELAGWAVAVEPSYAARLRQGEPCVVGRLERDRCLLDLRCVPEDADRDVLKAVLEH